MEFNTKPTVQEICPYCHTPMKSVYMFQVNEVFYKAHKNCCVPFKRHIEQALSKSSELPVTLP
jgi:hypothetical protein